MKRFTPLSPKHLTLRTLALVGIATATVLAPADLNRDFRWIPSGEIIVGDRASEAAVSYEALGTLVTTSLSYGDGSPGPAIGREVTGEEQFVLRPAEWRAGPAWAHLVLCRTVDSNAPPPDLTVSVDDHEVGTWRIRPPAGSQRAYDSYFVIPRTLFKDGKPPRTLRISIRADRPHLSLGYRIFADRSWDDLGDEYAGDLAAAAARATEPAVAAFLNAWLLCGDHQWADALAQFTAAAEQADEAKRPLLADSARFGTRWARLKQLRATPPPQAAAPTAEAAAAKFEAHYRRGLLAGAWGLWRDAAEEFRLAVAANPTHADATYRLAEALEYCRRPIAEWAPLMERAGFLGDNGHANVEHVLMAIYPYALPRDETGTFPGTGPLSQEDIDAIQRDWRYVEQQVYGASLGAWRLQTTYHIAGPDDPPWVMQAGWIFLPRDEVVLRHPGQYQYSIGTAAYGSSHAGGVDCGVDGAGGAQIGAQRGWEVFLHEWNHQFDWVSIFSESSPGYPVTHDSDGCGKQPIVNMGCGHRSSMRYYVSHAQYQRRRASDPVESAAFIDTWTVTPLLAPPDTDTNDADELAEWLRGQGHFTERQLAQIEREWRSALTQQEARAANPPRIALHPPPTPVPDWFDYLRARWNRESVLESLAIPEADAFVAGRAGTFGSTRMVAGSEDFVDLGTTMPAAPEKCVVYARAFVHVPADQEVRIWAGYNDRAQLWCNGRQLTEGRYYAVARWEDQNRPYMIAQHAQLRAGWNSLVVKLERGGGDWGFGIHIVDFENRPIAGLKTVPELPNGATAHIYTPPPAGPHYRWAEVRDDYLERLPHLSNSDLARLTGIPGVACTPERFLLTLPAGTQPLPGSRFIGDFDDDDTTFNNYLNWDRQAAAALRYEKDGQTRDLLIVRPEYFDEFLTLLREVPETTATEGPVADRVLGVIFLPEVTYRSTPNRPFTGRAVLVLDARLADYPVQEFDLLGI